MTRKEAQEILLLYRPSFDDPDDEPMQEALDLARQDPELAAWFEQHCQLQRKLVAVFKEIRVPEGLKEQIISERKSRFAIGKQRLTMAAACVCILASALLIAGQLGLLRLRPSDTFASFRERVVGDVHEHERALVHEGLRAVPEAERRVEARDDRAVRELAELERRLAREMLERTAAEIRDALEAAARELSQHRGFLDHPARGLGDGADAAIECAGLGEGIERRVHHAAEARRHREAHVVSFFRQQQGHRCAECHRRKSIVFQDRA